jgi:hypothetical protein
MLPYEQWSGTGTDTGARNGKSNNICIFPGGRVFAPFTGKIVYRDPKWGYVLLQSVNKVRYANGTKDYMTVGFMHDTDISDLPIGKTIKQFTKFYDAGGMENGNRYACSSSVSIVVFKGKVSSPGNYYGKGNVLAYQAFFISPKTYSFENYGAIEDGNVITKTGVPAYWSTKWKWTSATSSSSSQSSSGISNSDVSISGYTYPTTLTPGSTFVIKGTIRSSETIRKVTAGIYRSSNRTNAVYAKSVAPGSKSYNLAGLDPYLAFDKLSAGTYYYAVTATISRGTKVLLNRKFTVSKPAYAKITGYTYPKSMRKGQTFSVKGTVTSNSTLSRVTAGVYRNADRTGQVTGKEVNPGTKKYDLSQLDNYIYFDRLPKGTYYYIVSATNATGYKMLLRSKFVVS